MTFKCTECGSSYEHEQCSNCHEKRSEKSSTKTKDQPQIQIEMSGHYNSLNNETTITNNSDVMQHIESRPSHTLASSNASTTSPNLDPLAPSRSNGLPSDRRYKYFVTKDHSNSDSDSDTEPSYTLATSTASTTSHILDPLAPSRSNGLPSDFVTLDHSYSKIEGEESNEVASTASTASADHLVTRPSPIFARSTALASTASTPSTPSLTSTASMATPVRVTMTPIPPERATADRACEVCGHVPDIKQPKGISWQSEQSNLALLRV